MSGKTGLLRGGGVGAALGALAGPAFLLAIESRVDGGEALVAALGGAVTLGLLGGGLGLAAGAAFAGRRAESPDPRVRVRGLPGGVDRGLGPLDVLVAAAYGAALTGVLTVVLLAAVDGPRRLVRLVEELSPLGVLGPRQALLTAVGSLAVAVMVPLLALLSNCPRLRTLGRSHAVGITAAGFVAGVVWPPLSLFAIFGS